MAGEGGAEGGTMVRVPSRPLLDLSGAAIQGSTEDRNPAILLPNQTDDVSHFAIDIGGSLVKLVYFSRQAESSTLGNALLDRRRSFAKTASPKLGGRLTFVKFETSKLNDCIKFIQTKKLHCQRSTGPDQEVLALERSLQSGTTIKATGGGAFKYADIFKEQLGITIDKEDEMACLVSGANFLLRAIRHEAFTHLEGQKQFVQIDRDDLFPYLLVNIGSGVSIIKVDGHGQYERVSGTNVGGGTFWGLGRLLTKCKSFDEILELSQGGDNSAIDMLVGDIYGGLDYSKIGLSASTIASSFGKVIQENKDLSDYRREDIALSLLRMISYNIGQVAYLNALRYGLKRIFFGGFFIRGHAYTMDTMSFAIRFWSKGDAQAMFLRHEGYLGALGAFLSHDRHGLDQFLSHQFVERFPMGAPYVGGEIQGPAIKDLNEKITWMEKFVRKGGDIMGPIPMATPGTTGLGGFEPPLTRPGLLRSDSSAALSVGVLHLVPSLEPFPLLCDPQGYEPNTVDLSSQTEREYWFTILSDHLPGLVETAVASEGGTEDARRRGDAFAQAFRAHLVRLCEEPAAYGKLGLANLLEMREECLREFHFMDVYRTIKQRENEAALAVLPDLLAELDSMEPRARWLALIEGVLAANIFDWGSRACVELYQKGTILEIYRMSKNKMQRPWRVDDFDALEKRLIGDETLNRRHNLALLFVDNSGADVVLGMLPLARELLRRGTEVVLVANSLPAINDVTALELPAIVAAAAKNCDVLRQSARAGDILIDLEDPKGNEVDASAVKVPSLMVVENGCGSPCIDFRQVSSELAAIAKDADLVFRRNTKITIVFSCHFARTPVTHLSFQVLQIILEGMGRALHTNYNAQFKCDALKVNRCTCLTASRSLEYQSSPAHQLVRVQLAMIKNQRLAEQLVGGNIYDCFYSPNWTSQVHYGEL